MKYIKSLDTIRCIAILLVIRAHWGPSYLVHSTPLTIFFTKILPGGMFGVDLFFVLSGYLITKILLSARENTFQNERMEIIKSFYIRRALRIFPIYFLYIFISGYVLNEEGIKNGILYYVTYTSNFIAFGMVKILFHIHGLLQLKNNSISFGHG